MKPRKVTVFSSVRMEYVAKMSKLTDLPVESVCALSEAEYRRLAGQGHGRRLWLRVQMYLFYPLRVVWRSITASRSDVLLVSSNTFYAPLIAWVSSRARRPRVLHWRCDLYPDALVVARTIRTGGIMEKAIGLIQTLTQRYCDGVVSVGAFLCEHANRRWGYPRRSFYIDNVPSDENLFAPREARHPGLTFHYGGQLGYMHDPESLLVFVRAACNRRDSGARFDFRVSGPHRTRFENNLAEMGLKTHPPMPADQWKELIRDFQIGLVSLSPGGATVSLPSKLYSMMAGGLAIVAVCPAWSDLAQIILQNRCGWVVNNSPFETEDQLQCGDYLRNCAQPRDLSAIARDSEALVARLFANPAEVEACQRAAVEAARLEFGLEALRIRWSQVFCPAGS